MECIKCNDLTGLVGNILPNYLLELISVHRLNLVCQFIEILKPGISKQISLEHTQAVWSFKHAQFISQSGVYNTLDQVLFQQEVCCHTFKSLIYYRHDMVDINLFAETEAHLQS